MASKLRPCGKQQIGNIMAILKVHKTTTVPGTLEADSIYFVSSGTPYVQIYVTDSTGAARRLMDEARVDEKISAALAAAGSGASLVDDIAERDAIATPFDGQTALVFDASADATVTSGSATYVYRQSTTAWVKISESESMDLTLSWANITGRPTSAVADIDDAVSKRHTHANMTQLNQIGDDGNGNMTYNGNLPKIAWGTAAW
jgi:hypothetical protein